MRTRNPALNDRVFEPGAGDRALAAGEAMTIQGTVAKTALSLLILLLTASMSWTRALRGFDVTVLMWVGIGGGLVAALVTIFKKEAAPVTTPVYAALEGLALGGISALMEMRFPGIVLQAVGLTFGTLASLLLAYRTGLIRASANFVLGVTAATGGILLVYVSNFVLGLFGIRMGFIHESGPLGIGFSLFVVVIAALNLVLDFDFIEKGAERRAPKHMEWYGAFGLMVTLVWLYLEILRLLGKARSRD